MLKHLLKHLYVKNNLLYDTSIMFVRRLTTAIDENGDGDSASFEARWNPFLMGKIFILHNKEGIKHEFTAH